ncbi:unnamed protein product, partial [Anisakis simplex]|uniref:DUF4201 domain-containing protein n=1 Tax=Anisakis simplex TaxID=6269 RepID=A0A0M3KCE7_ANISI
MENIPENSGKQKIETITEETINFIDGQEDDHVELHEENAEVDGGTPGETTGAAGASEETAGAVGEPGETTETEQALGEAIEAAVALGEAIGAAGASEEATAASGAPQLPELPRVEGLPYRPLDELSLRVSEPGAAQTAPVEPQRTPDALYTSYDEGLGLTAGGHGLISADLMHPGDLSTSSYSIAETTMIDSSSLLRMASAPMRSRQFESSMEKTNEELNSFKRRIDANTEEQREHADLMADLQRKIEDYRRRIAAIENQQIVSKPEESITFNIKEATGPEDIFGSDFKMTQEVGLDTSSVMLEEERRRNNELRLQIARQKMELDMLRQQFEMNIRDKDKAFQMREQNLAQYLSEEQQKMLSLWDELQRIRAEFAQYREETERDLESQRNEFVRVSKGVGGIVRKLSLNAFNVVDGGGKDNELIEALKRFQEQIASPRDQNKVSDEHDTLMKKYEQAIERIVELESHDDGSSARLTLLEAELKRTKQKLSDSQNALRIVQNMAKEAEAKSGQKRRPRPTALQPNEVVRSVRCTLRGYEGDLQQLQRNFKNSELQLEELSRRYENVEDMRKRLEKQLADTKKEL